MSPNDLTGVLAWLDRFHLDQVPHAGRSLRQHLIGTARLLADWGEREVVCLAGLCHSVYGTEVFRARSIPLSDRTYVTNGIGAEAEHLSYLFCAMTRDSLRENLSRRVDYQIVDRIAGTRLPITEQELRDLMAISLANMLDQRPYLPPREHNARRDEFLAARHLLNDVAYAAALHAYNVTPADPHDEAVRRG